MSQDKFRGRLAEIYNLIVKHVTHTHTHTHTLNRNTLADHLNGVRHSEVNANIVSQREWQVAGWNANIFLLEVAPFLDKRFIFVEPHETRLKRKISPTRSWPGSIIPWERQRLSIVWVMFDKCDVSMCVCVFGPLGSWQQTLTVYNDTNSQ